MTLHTWLPGENKRFGTLACESRARVTTLTRRTHDSALTPRSLLAQRPAQDLAGAS